MDVHASPDELPELKECLGSFEVRFRRPEGADALERYTTGLLTERPTKNCDTIAQAVPGTREQRRQEFLTNRPWDEEDLNHQRVQKMIAEATLGGGTLVLDDPGVAKQGTTSVGVARQSSGTLGTVGNCQIAVTCCDTDSQATWPVAVRMYLPQAWAEDTERRQSARVPPAVTFQTKPEIALRLRDQARAWGVPQHGVVAEADDGATPNFLAGLEARQERDVVGVRVDVRISPQRQATSPVQRADRLLHRVPRWPWRTVRWRQGTTGWLRKKFVAVRCWRVTSDGQRHVGWLLGERASPGQPEERKYAWSNLPATADVGGVGWVCPSPICRGAVSRGSQRRGRLGSISGTIVAGLPSACRHGDAGIQLPGLAGAGAAPPYETARSPTPPVFPLGRIGVDVRSRLCPERWPGGSATKRSHGG